MSEKEKSRLAWQLAQYMQVPFQDREDINGTEFLEIVVNAVSWFLSVVSEVAERDKKEVIDLFVVLLKMTVK